MAEITSSINSGVSIHNNLLGLNEGDYVHLTRIEKNKIDNLPYLFVTNHSELSLNDGTNPHGTTKSDVGLYYVDNTSDIDKPVSDDQSTAIGLKENSSNKSTSIIDSTSLVKFPVWSVIVSYFDITKIKSILGISTLSGSNTGDQDLSGYVSTSRTLTINGTTKNLAADRSFTITTSPEITKRQQWLGIGGTFNLVILGVRGNDLPSYVGAATNSDSSVANRIRHKRVSATAVGSSAEIWTSPSGIDHCSMNYGFKFAMSFTFSSANTNTKGFYGFNLTSSTASPNVEPSTFLNMLGIGFDTTDINLQLMHNDGTGTATKVDLGSGWVKTISDNYSYKLEMTSTPNSYVVNWNLKRYSMQTINGVSVLDIFEQETSGFIDTNLPTNSLLWRAWSNNSAQTTEVSVSVSQVTIDTAW